MYSTNSSMYSLNLQSRAICPINSSKEETRFAVGSCSVHEDNSLVVLTYKEESSQLELANTYIHPDQIWNLQTSHNDSTKVMTCGQPRSESFFVKLWSMPNQSLDGSDDLSSTSNPSEPTPLEELAQVRNIDSSSAHHIAWHKGKESTLITSSTYVALVELTESSAEIVKKMSVEDGVEIAIEDSAFGNGVSACDPHSDHSSASAFGSNIHIIDWRSGELTSKLLGCHGVCGTIRDIDYNPNKPQTLISCGDDRRVKFWDLRKPSLPVQTLGGHSHWVWNCKYNPFHDQLVLSGGSDHSVNLWRVASASSAPWLVSADDYDESASFDEDSNGTTSSSNNVAYYSSGQSDSKSADPPDAKVKSFDQHTESVYGLSWSAADAWTFASLSIDGRIFVNHVPSTEKYKILL